MKTAVWAMAAAMTVMTATTGRADERAAFSNASLNGAYAFSASGTIGYSIRSAASGISTFDGAGLCTVRTRLNVGGVVVTLTSALCTYTVNADGSGTLNVAFNEGGAFISDFVITDDGRQTRFVLSDPIGSTVADGVSIRQETP